MAYNGYLLKFGSTVLPMDYIRIESYSSTPAQRLDLDSYRDADGVLHRSVLPHTASKIEWETPFMTGAQIQAMMSIFRASWTSNIERKVTVTYYNEETDDYSTGEFYMPDIQFKIYAMLNGQPQYLPVRIAIIEY